MNDCFEKFFRWHRLSSLWDCLAGAEARPTNLIMLYGWAKGP